MRVRPAVRREAILWAAAALFGAFSALLVIRPLHAAAVDYDSAASVLYFERITSGRHLEGAIGATPKPLLTVVFGLLHAMFHDWRPVEWASITAYAAGIGGAAVLARRLAGLAAAVFVAVGLVGSTMLLVDVSRAYAVSWAMLGWVVAGLCLTRTPPRYGLAGLALLLAGLARIETLVIVVVAAAALLMVTILAKRRHAESPPRSALLLLLGFLAVPVMCIHDWLLTGDPFFWVHVAERFSVAVPDVIAVQTPSYMVAWLVRFVVSFGFVSMLAVVGIGSLIVRRRHAVLLGLLALGPGVGAFLVLLTARGTFVSTRYAAPIELAIIFGAGVGFGSLRITWLGHALNRLSSASVQARWWVPVRITAVVLVSALASASLAKAFAPFDPATTHTIRSELIAAANADRVTPEIRRRLATRSQPNAVGATTTGPLLLVPALMQPRFAVDTSLPLPAIGSVADQQPGGLAGVPGRVIFHDRRADPAGSLTALESDQPMTIDGLRLDPLVVDPSRGYWLWQVAD